MATTYSMGDLKKGLRIEIDKIPYKIVEYQHVKPGKGAAFVRCKIKNFLNGKVIDKTFHAGDKCQAPDMAVKDMQFLYSDGENCEFMDNTTYEQISIPYKNCQEAMKWAKEGSAVSIQFHDGVAISVDVADVVELEVKETPPNFKGDTSSTGKKPATLETGTVVQVPFHILEGDKVKINTIEGAYLEKVK